MDQLKEFIYPQAKGDTNKKTSKLVDNEAALNQKIL